VENLADTTGGDLTVLFTDIAGSTEMVERLGEDRWFDLLFRHNAIVRAHVDVSGGREVKRQGDGFMLAFADAAAAVTCAAGIHRSLRHLRCPVTGDPVRVRIGGDAGVVRPDGTDLLGFHVHLAARITESAGAEEILVSAAVRDRAGDALAGAGCRWGRTWATPLRGVREPVDVVQVDWDACVLDTRAVFASSA
jgi:class 3 adenylate cyclase